MNILIIVCWVLYGAFSAYQYVKGEQKKTYFQRDSQAIELYTVASIVIGAPLVAVIRMIIGLFIKETITE